MCECCEEGVPGNVSREEIPQACVPALMETLRDWIRGVAFATDSIAYLDEYGDEMDKVMDELGRRAVRGVS